MIIFGWFTKVIVSGLIVVLVSALSAITYQWLVISDFENTYQPPGELVDVGGYSIHLHCSGVGPQTVILEAGSGMWSMDWYEVQKGISSFARVCSYDRAGHGWSEFGSEPRTINQIVEELHVLLSAAGLPGPFVMVGASFGGSIVQLYEKAHPENVSALVLVDARPKGYTTALRKIAGEAVENVSQERGIASDLFNMGFMAAIVYLQSPFEFENNQNSSVISMPILGD